MAHHRLLVWIISERCLGSSGFFHLFAGWVWRGTVFLSFMSNCYLFSLHVAPDFWSLKCFLHAGTHVKHRQGAVCSQCRASRRVQPQSGGQPFSWWGLRSVAWGSRHSFDVRPTRPHCGVPCPACLVGAVERQGCWLCCFSLGLGACWSLQRLCPHSCALAGTWK